ncbi:50S ribosomal protein L18 [Candidatus Woesearchaeota archaeon CG_4_10_14_0_2_um_filter_33_13]|nr:MAG: 50S ribosomal protein L18 [Candidatus Woesearchaeota archaeon CG_4_10_14_0_2_um_filter_33_13]
MATKKPQTVQYRRKREGKTSYQKRMKLLMSGQPRVVVRLTNQKIIGQVISFNGKGDLVLAGTDSFALKKLGWKGSCKNIPSAYLTGLLLGKKTLDQKCSEAVFDTGLRGSFGQGRIAAFLKGAIDAGLNIPFGSEEIFPAEERINGAHINESLKNDIKIIKQKIMGK